MNGSGPVGTADLAQEGFAALRSGQFQDARAVFAALVARPGTGATAWLGLAHASAALGEGESVNAALAKALELEPDNLHALVFQAEFLANTGQPRKALPFYERAARMAAASASTLAPDLAQALRRGRALQDRYAAEYADFVRDNFPSEVLAESSARFRQALDICTGRKQVFLQNPSRFYFPELPQRQFYEREEFDWAPVVESATGTILQELSVAMGSPGRFQPYLQSAPGPQLPDPTSRAIRDNPDWGALYLWEYGAVVEENASAFPMTMGVLREAPLPFVRRQLPIVLFSKLAGGTHIPPHHGLLNTRLICHLPLIVPPHCGTLRCGNEERPWEVGKLLVFDDSIEHEAWNHSQDERVVLLFDIWRPELTPDERVLVSQLLETVAKYNDQPG